jgi:hypothetical protein
MEKRKMFIGSIILNLILMGMMCFIAVYKRDRIVYYFNKIFVSQESVEKKREAQLAQFNLEPYETEIMSIKNNSNETVRVAFLGNSLSLIDGWPSGGFGAGLAASDVDHDYIHLLLNEIVKRKNVNIEYVIINIADFERDFINFNYSRLDKIKSFDPDITLFQIGENVSGEDIRSSGEIFKNKYIELVNYINCGRNILCLPFWPDKDKLYKITEVAIESKSYLVDLSYLGSGIDTLNFAKSEKKYENPGVGIHPGDYGMKNIAMILFATMNIIIE